MVTLKIEVKVEEEDEEVLVAPPITNKEPIHCVTVYLGESLG